MYNATVWFVGGEDIRFRLPLLLELRKRGFDVGAVGSEVGEAFREQGIPYFRYSLKREFNPMADMRCLRELQELFSEHEPDVVHAFDTKPTILAPIAARRAGVPARVRTITGMGHLFSCRSLQALALRPAYRYMQRQASKACGMTIFQNEEDRAYFLMNRMAEPGRHALVRGSGVDVQHLIDARPDEETLARLRGDLGLNDHLVVIMIARLVKQKGIREYLRAARLASEIMPNVAFLLVGPAATEHLNRISPDEVHGAKGVRYLGPRTDVPALLALSDLFVLPSYYREGVPRALLEAGAMGLPLITCDTPGCRDVVRQGWNGIVIPPRDSEALGRAIVQVLRGKHTRASMGARSRKHVLEHFTIARVADAQAEIYRHLLEPEIGPVERAVAGS